MNIFVKCWRGEAPLWQAFWLVGLVFTTIIKMFIGLIGGIIIIYTGKINTSAFTILIIYTNIIILPYLIFVYISIWKCGKNAALIWNILSKIAVILGVIIQVSLIYNWMYASKDMAGYEKQAWFSEVIESTSPYKEAVEACYKTQGGGLAVTNCAGGQNGVPGNIVTGQGNVGSILVSSDGVITATGSALNGLNTETYILTPVPQNNTLTWKVSGQCIEDKLCCMHSQGNCMPPH